MADIKSNLDDDYATVNAWGGACPSLLECILPRKSLLFCHTTLFTKLLNFDRLEQPQVDPPRAPSFLIASLDPGSERLQQCWGRMDLEDAQLFVEEGSTGRGMGAVGGDCGRTGADRHGWRHTAQKL